jgi:putative transposase
MNEKELAARRARAQDVGLFRYALTREAADPALTTRQRGRLVREIAAREHTGPDGKPTRVTRWTVDRWIAAWRAGGFDALVPTARRVEARTAAEVLELAVALKRENPERTAAQVRRILTEQLGAGRTPALRTLQRHFADTGLGPGARTRPAGVFSRFQADHPNDLWTGDNLHGPLVGGAKTYLFAVVDDHSRAVMGYRWSFHEDTLRASDALRTALTARGLPLRLYLDNGAAFVDHWLRRACATLDIRLTHSAPYRPEGRGKIERFFETVRGQFLVEIAPPGGGAGHTLTGLDDLNRLFQAWVEAVYHRQVHSETGAAPLARWHAATGAPLRHASPAAISEAFLWSDTRVVSRAGLIKLWSNAYQAPAHLAGQRVECLFDPRDLTAVRLRLRGHDEGTATPFEISQHSHPKARPDTPTAPPRPTGIDYLALVEERHTATLAEKINYSALVDRKDTP